MIMCRTTDGVFHLVTMFEQFCKIFAFHTKYDPIIPSASIPKTRTSPLKFIIIMARADRLPREQKVELKSLAVFI